MGLATAPARAASIPPEAAPKPSVVEIGAPVAGSAPAQTLQAANEDEHMEVAASEVVPDVVVAAILRDVRVHPDALGRHSLDLETENGIVVKTSGSQGPRGGSHMQGMYSYPLEDGTMALITFVADEGGYQPVSDLLPVAPLPLHPVPQHALDQIAFGQEQRRLQAQAATPVEVEAEAAPAETKGATAEAPAEGETEEPVESV
ncbi:uncharacterized protein LOC143019426 [Oratosquilla oratoria]|uniref:uncharacterized protein LOC143019426 n=1 Tax=Oratosquilla oratoria TaxID=337810 RepID=UPI003F75FE1A